MKKPQNCTVIVDPYSAGAMLAEALQERGAECVAVESSPTHPANMKSRFSPDSFREVIRHQSDFDHTLAAVRSHRPTHVLAGFESGVEFAEQLSVALSLPTNDPTLREARRDKFLMAQAVNRHGLRTALQFSSRHVEEIIDWIRNTLDWPVIVKPPRSAASDNVFRCRGVDEVRRAAETILTQANALGADNQAVLVQEFLDGVEYAVDTVSLGARRKLTAIWQYRRPAGSDNFVCYDAMTLLPYTGTRQDALRDYAFEVLSALSISFGPAHCELMWVGGEPVLVEVGARLTGGINAILSRICGGTCQLDETVESVLAPDRFLATLHESPILKRRAANVFLITHHQGRLKRTHGLDQISRLPTLHSMSVASRPGMELKRVSGLITLVDENMHAIEQDIDVIRSLESPGMFELEVDEPQC